MRLMTLMILAVAMVLAAMAPAQPDAAPPPAGCPPECPRLGWGKLETNMENLRLIKLLEAVDLSQEQSEKFVPLFHGFRKDTKALHEQQKQLIDSLAEMVRRDASDDRIDRTLKDLEANRGQVDARWSRFLVDCGAVLTRKQVARLVVFHERFDREMLEALREFRRHPGAEPGRNREGKP